MVNDWTIYLFLATTCNWYTFCIVIFPNNIVRTKSILLYKNKNKDLVFGSKIWGDNTLTIHARVFWNLLLWFIWNRVIPTRYRRGYHVWKICGLTAVLDFLIGISIWHCLLGILVLDMPWVIRERNLMNTTLI